MLIRCLDTGAEYPISHILQQLRNSNTLSGNYEIIKIQGKVSIQLNKLKLSSGNASMTDYLQNCHKATKECMIIMENDPYGETNFNTNIFCPYHEIRGKSKTPSAKLYVDSNTFKCFSSSCKKKCNSVVLLKYLKTQQNKYHI